MTTTTEQPKPATLQEVEKKLTEAIFNLGRARYERLLAEAREEAMVKQASAREEAAAKQASDLAEQAHNLRKKIQAEMQQAVASQSPNLTVVQGGAEGTKP